MSLDICLPATHILCLATVQAKKKEKKRQDRSKQTEMSSMNHIRGAKPGGITQLAGNSHHLILQENEAARATAGCRKFLSPFLLKEVMRLCV